MGEQVFAFLFLVLAHQTYCQFTEGYCSIDDKGCNLAIDESLNELDQDDPKLIEIIRTKYLTPPSTKGYDFDYSTRFRSDDEDQYPYIQGQYLQPPLIDKLFNRSKWDGFFIEAGAHDGYLISNSLYFELKYNWTGLLVEPNPKIQSKLAQSGRKAWTLPYCFSTKTRPEVVKFHVQGLLGGIVNTAKKTEEQTTNRDMIQIQCFPLYSVLMALGNPRVDYFTLDIEGAELQVLETIPFDKVDIQVLDIEMNHVGEVFEGSRNDIRNLLHKNGYRLWQKMSIDEVFDVIEDFMLLDAMETDMKGQELLNQTVAKASAPPVIDPEAIIAVPGMGFLPQWFVRQFESLSDQLKIDELFRNDTWRRNKANCDIVSQLFESGIVPIPSEVNSWCPPLYDNASCFPATPVGQVMVIPCMSEYSGVPYDTSGNASRSCSIFGEWEERTNYNNCQAIAYPVPPLVSTDYSSTIYLFGYILSFAALSFAIVIYFTYRELWCLRNKLHLNLFLVYWFSIFSWMCQALAQNFFLEHPPLICCTLVALRYFHLTTFFWMFVEGLYLWIKVSMPLQTYTIKLRHYICLGWITPLIIVVTWTTVTFLTIESENATRTDNSSLSAGSTWKGHDPYMLSCPIVDTDWQLDWSYNIFLLLLLLGNCFFLFSIMMIVIAKVRNDPTNSEGNLHNYRSTKALLVLSALLGVGYIVTMAPPTTDIHGYRVFQYLRAILLSLQGFIITIPYCFINWRVKNLIRESIKRMKEERQFQKETIARSSRNSISLGMFHSTTNANSTRFSTATATTTLSQSTVPKIQSDTRPMQPIVPNQIRTGLCAPVVQHQNGTSPRDVYATIHETTSLVEDKLKGDPSHKDVTL
ncbi:hypothetical protein TCAL_09333 [Tigriopus californicus]|uniref:G-protein coupled receptors family 2 profile 2 domain-containing protein n=2 Tax=Tigriopus californicus TaxID=6832 RepID=A0A553PPB0_TIGCA|nr:hypothetical protein TCAL_09333 [Tigriopus californicus]